MGTDSRIEWCDHTMNFWIGCTKTKSPGCQNCYMYRDRKRYSQDPSVVTRTSPQTWNQPPAKDKNGSFKWAPGSRVFVCSWSDYFHPAADEWRASAISVMLQRPDLVWIILTKRPERSSVQEIPPGSLYGVTVENQEQADIRVPLMLQSGHKGLCFVSCEPLLSDVDLSTWLGISRYEHGAPWARDTGSDLDLVIVGGETGLNARPMHPDWVRSIRDQCNTSHTLFFFKQWGEYATQAAFCKEHQPPKIKIDPLFMRDDGMIADIPVSALQGDTPDEGETNRHTWTRAARVGKRHAGHMLDGREWREFPTSKQQT